MIKDRAKIHPKKLVLFFLSLLLCFFSSYISAAPENTSLSQVIDIDNVASSAVEAKKKALEEGEGLALNQLYFFLQHALVPLSPSHTSSPITLDDLKPFFTGYEVLTEKNSTTRYIAKIKYQFNDAAIKELFERKNWKITTSPEKKLLIIPMTIESSKNKKLYTLWEPSPWLKAWRSQIKNFSFLPVTLPLGDMEDISTLQPNEAAIEGLYPAFQHLKKRYNTSLGVLISVAAPIYETSQSHPPSQSNSPAIKNKLAGIKIYLLHGFIPKELIFPSFTIKRKEHETSQEFYNRAVQLTYSFIIEQWRLYKDLIQKNKTKKIEFNKKEVIIPLPSSYDWFFWQENLKKLRKTTNITNFQLKTLSSNEVSGILSFYGDISTVQRQLRRLGLHLAFHKDRWTLQDAKLPSQE